LANLGQASREWVVCSPLDRLRFARQDRRMFFDACPTLLRRRLFLLISAFFIASTLAVSALGQGYVRDLETPETVSLTVKNKHGRVTVIASDDQAKKVSISATSAGAPIDESQIKVTTKGEAIDIDVQDRGEKDRIDLTVRIPSRSKLIVDGDV